jgi:hypothetical protein
MLLLAIIAAGCKIFFNMKYRSLILRVGLVMSLLLVVVPQPSTAASSPELRLTQLNITGDEYVTIQNTGNGPLDLSKYWLGYSGSDTATAVPAQQLSVQTLQAQETVMLNNGAAQTCGAIAVDNLSFSLSNTAGTLALWRLDSPADSAASFSFLGGVSWGKAATSTSYLHIADESNVAKYNTQNALPTWLRAAQSWQVGDMQSCQFTPVVVQNNVPTAQGAVNVNWPVSNDTPPFTVLPPAIIPGSAGNGSSASIPASDIGLNAVQLSEIMPNPASPKTDADDEFIELYNPNPKPFDLSGFKLQIVSATSSTVHSYTIPSGTTIPAKGFKAFMSSDTNLSLNNSAGQAWFVDPLDHTVGTTGVYSDVTEGASYINTNGKWQWTMAPTPGAANKLQAVVGKSGSTSKKSASVNGRSMTGLTSGGSAVNGASTGASFDQAVQTVPLHPGTLAAVVALALLYLGYEYRRDVANKIQQFRENRAART